MNRDILALLLLSIIGSGAAQAAIYTWVDENGVTHFSEAKEVLHSKPVEVEGYYGKPAKANKPDDKHKEQRDPVVIMYSGSRCSTCDEARSYLDERGIRYSDYNIERSPMAYQNYQLLGGNELPLFSVDGQPIQGFQRAHFERILGNH